MTTKTENRPAALALPAALEEVALIDAPTCAAIGGMSVSWWNEQVRTARAPQPVIRASRLTRWRMTDVRSFWATFADRANTEAAQRLMAQATKASAAAKRRRTGEGS